MPTRKIFPGIQTLSEALAAHLAEIAEQAIVARARFLLALNGGGTPQILFELLGSRAYREKSFWRDTFVFWGDERCVPPDADGSSYKQAADAFLKRVPIPEDQIVRIKGELPPEEAAKAYASQLLRFAASGLGWPRFDLVLLGMGGDGHTASLFPGQYHGDAHTSTIAVTAEYEDRPANRVSLTPAVFNAARNVYFMAAGAKKAETLAAVRAGPFLPDVYPSQLIRPTNGELIWWLDEAVAGVK